MDADSSLLDQVSLSASHAAGGKCEERGLGMLYRPLMRWEEPTPATFSAHYGS